jgi:sarcosine oxidase
VLADLVTTGETTSDVSAYSLDRPALTQPGYQAHWLV